jgi:hypothetical protein
MTRRRPLLFATVCAAAVTSAAAPAVWAQDETPPPPSHSPVPPAPEPGDATPPAPLPGEDVPPPAGTAPTVPIPAEDAGINAFLPRPAPDSPVPNATGEATDGTPADEKDVLVIDRADRIDSPSGSDKVIASGDVQLRYNGYRITCDRATYDTATRTVTFESRVALYTSRQVVYADYLSLNLRTRAFSTQRGRTVVPPDLVGPNLLEPLILEGRSVRRDGRDTFAEDGYLTTCDFPFPHYRVFFKRAQIVPNRRIILHKATIYQYDRRVLTIPYLVIPIRDQIRYSYLPQFGRTQEEGYFVKSALGYALGDAFPGIFRLDAMQKKGIGIGADQAYRIGQVAAGTVALYTLNDRSRDVQNLNGRLYHQQRLGAGILATLSSDFQNNSYFASLPDTKSQNTNLTLNRSVGGSTTGVTFTNTRSTTGTTSSSRFNTFSITQQQRFGQNFNVNLRLNGQDQSSSFTSTTTGTDGQPVTTTTNTGNEQQTGDIRATGRLGIFDVDLNANKNLLSKQTTATGSQSLFTGTERLPEISLATDARRIGGAFAALPLRFRMGLGRFVENPGSITTSRALFDVDANPRPLEIGGRASGLTLNWAGGFSQYVYDARDAAQYVLDSRATLEKRWGTLQTLSFSYNYLRPYGGTPIYLRTLPGTTDPTPYYFRLDSVGSANLVNANYGLNGSRVRISLQTSYDIRESQRELIGGGGIRSPWSPLALQLSLRPSAAFQTRFVSSYDLNTNRLTDLRNNARLRSGAFALDTGFRYDPRQKRFPQIAGALESPFFFDRNLRIAAYASYNQVIRRFDYKQFYLTKSLHDYEVTLGYLDQPYGGFRAERGFTFSFRLKAFPASIQNTGGQYGTSLGFGSGDVF